VSASTSYNLNEGEGFPYVVKDGAMKTTPEVVLVFDDSLTILR